ncbi:MFS family permease [Gluconobacter cerinus]|uniref:MFS transporter n=1 Tax=Gluconobacter cerinus TaxID=38307 RepID=UPI002225C1AC|nr:MFS transporter [Gluconobacter cerinus]MCW2266188.1 MFS family permease [Gluconobacter cerinus]
MMDTISAPSALGRSASLALVLYCYAMVVASMADIGIFVSFLPRVAHELAIASTQAGFALSLFSVPSALACVPIGRLVDRIGIRAGMVMAGLLVIVGDVCLGWASGWVSIYAGMCLTGAGFGCLTVTCPSALVSWLGGDIRTRALSFWSTYGPVGYACGLLLAVPFSVGALWRHAFLLHALIFTVLVCCAALLPLRKARVDVKAVSGGLSLLFHDMAVIRLAMALALPNAVAYGVSVIIPSYLGRIYGVELGMSNSGIAAAKIFAMLLGGVLTGYVLTRQIRFRALYRSLACFGLGSLFVLFFPNGTFALSLVALICWLLAFGGMAGAATAQLPTLVTKQEDIGVVSGLVGQLTSLICLTAPPVYLALTHWSAYWGLSCAALLIAALSVPYREANTA